MFRYLAVWWYMLSVYRTEARPQCPGPDRCIQNDPLNAYDASEYLLNVDELAIASSVNAPRNSLDSLSSGVHTSDGQVKLFVNGDTYFEHMYQTMSSTQKGDVILLTGWDVHTDFLLDPKITNFATTRILTQFTMAMERGVDVGVIWSVVGNPFALPSMLKICDYIDKAWQKRTGNDRIGGCFFDTNFHETRLQSAHAKTVFMSVAGRHMAYVSGMDLATQQWDMIGHEGALRDRYRKRQPSAGLDPLWTTGWADAGAFVDGQLATDVKTTFRQRWNALPRTVLEPFVIHAETVPPQYDVIQPNRPAAQILRTFAGGAGHSFASDGEVTHVHALHKMVKAAKHFVIVHDQYAYAKEIVTLLNHGVVKTTIVTQELTALGRFNNIVKYRQEQASNMPNTKMYAIQFPVLVPPRGPLPAAGSTVYVHSKIVIVDGLAAIIGSANMCQRSFFTDHEITVAVVDPVVVRSFMIVLVAQWLAVTEASLSHLTHNEIHELLRSRPDTNTTHLATYTPDGEPVHDKMCN